jgi:hypothetical protein
MEQLPRISADQAQSAFMPQPRSAIRLPSMGGYRMATGVQILVVVIVNNLAISSEGSHTEGPVPIAATDERAGLQTRDSTWPAYPR